MAKTDPRIIKTLRDIDHALIETLKDHPFDKITVEMLCKSAMINRSTFYKYYEDKHHLLNDFLDRTLNHFQEILNTDFILANPRNVDSEYYQSLFRDILHHLYGKRETYRVLWTASFGRNVWTEMVGIARDNILNRLDIERESIPDIDRKHILLYTHLFATDLMSMIDWWFANEPYITMDDVINAMTSNMHQGTFKTFYSYLK